MGRRAVQPRACVRVIANDRNVGFGAAVNQAFRESNAPFIAVLNDDAAADPSWLEALMAAIESRPDVGMCASQVRLAGDGRLDSAGMLLCRDGSSKQRGHLESPASFASREEALLPSGCAAIYRREMLEEIGLFDESFFLYCEDTDLGLRARWAGWDCLYVPDAIVEHRYSHSAGKASALKAYYVERNRLFLVVKNFPARDLLLAPFYSAGALLLACGLRAAGPGEGGRIPAGRQHRRAIAALCSARLPGDCSRAFPQLLRQRRRDETPPHPRAVSPPDPPILDQTSPGGRAVKQAAGTDQPDKFLVLIPAFNEAGAIAGVVREVRQVVPEGPDPGGGRCFQGRARSARPARAGAEVLRLPYHLGLGGCVQAGYKLAYELGYEYVIRVDGDGQHDPKLHSGSAQSTPHVPAATW